MDEVRRLNSQQVEEMGRLVTAYFAGEGRPARVTGYNVAFGDGTHGGLANLAESLAELDFDEWPRAIAEHFETLAAEPGRPASWEEAAAMVRLRVDPAGRTDASTVVWPVNDELVVTLVVAAHGGSLPVTDAELSDWHVKPELAFDRALHNSLEAEPAVDEVTQLADGTDIHSIRGGPYTSAHLLALEQHVTEAPGGAVVALPTEDTLLYHRLVDYTAVAAINTLAEEAARLHAAGDATISPHLFWWRGGELTPLPAKTDGGKVAIQPPPEFVALLGEIVESTKQKRRRFFGRDGK